MGEARTLPPAVTPAKGACLLAAGFRLTGRPVPASAPPGGARRAPQATPRPRGSGMSTDRNREARVGLRVGARARAVGWMPGWGLQEAAGPPLLLLTDVSLPRSLPL